MLPRSRDVSVSLTQTHILEGEHTRTHAQTGAQTDPKTHRQELRQTPLRTDRGTVRRRDKCADKCAISRLIRREKHLGKSCLKGQRWYLCQRENPGQIAYPHFIHYSPRRLPYKQCAWHSAEACSTAKPFWPVCRAPSYTFQEVPNKMH